MKLPSFIYLLFLLLLTTSVNAQIGDVIKQKAFQQKERSGDSDNSAVRDLAHSITRKSVSKEEKVAAIFSWITSNVSYDNELHYSRKMQKEVYTSQENVLLHVLKRKKALCGGFAILFEALCKEVGVKSTTIHGYTKNSAVKGMPKQVNHSWNAVHINNEWKLLDITWAISHGSNKSPNMFWYFTKPSDFIRSHFPEQTKWTLLKKPVSKESFFSKP